jgi:hypothetical protein
MKADAACPKDLMDIEYLKKVLNETRTKG